MHKDRKMFLFIIACVRGVMTLFGYKIINKHRIKNMENCIIAANHISLFDPPFVGSIFKKEISTVAKSELFENKLLGGLIRYLNAIPIKRGRVDRVALTKVKEIIKSGNSILLFPEGTRKSDTAKPGIGKIALETRTNVLPVFILNSNNLLACLFRKKRLKIVVGEMIQTKDFMQKDITKESYRSFAKMVLGKINELEDEC
jgi:1-acyl-sn-glycerol-3-phosphate acyltransferase